MIEEEAKTKWCPFALTHAHKYDTKMREVNDDLCIGSACMAWRWRTSLGINSEYPSSLGETAGGYCGLAGKP